VNKLESFPPLVALDAKLLILGSMPGKQSLEIYQYYAHSQNAFWPIMSHLFNFSVKESYSARVSALIAAEVAVWDVMMYCSRKSSLDSDIVESSIIPNDIELFLNKHVGIKRIYFNGTKAEQSYLKYVKPTLNRQLQGLAYLRLPSTSPAYAGLSFTDKLEKWSRIIR
jgi:hypoxanthine-DNA glycosylase